MIVTWDYLKLFGSVDFRENTLHRLQLDPDPDLHSERKNPDPIFVDTQNKRSKVGRTYKN